MAEPSPLVKSGQEGAVVTLTINDPEHRNALGMGLIQSLDEALRTAEGDRSVRVVILVGAGDKAFCAGADLKEALGRRTTEEHLAYAMALEGLFIRLRGLRCPTIAAVNGAALAGGLGLLLCCDLAIASHTALFGTPEVRVGLWPMMVTALLREQLGTKRAMELCMCGDPITAGKAESWGLVNQVVPSAELLPASMQLAQKLAVLSPDILAAGKRAWHTNTGAPIAEALPALARELSELSTTPAAQEGLTAFVERRPPSW